MAQLLAVLRLSCNFGGKKQPNRALNWALDLKRAVINKLFDRIVSRLNKEHNSRPYALLRQLWNLGIWLTETRCDCGEFVSERNRPLQRNRTAYVRTNIYVLLVKYIHFEYGAYNLFKNAFVHNLCLFP